MRSILFVYLDDHVISFRFGTDLLVLLKNTINLCMRASVHQLLSNLMLHA